jgi:hypothetical protein
MQNTTTPRANGTFTGPTELPSATRTDLATSQNAREKQKNEDP